MTASYPPHLLRARGTLPGAPRRGQEQQPAQSQAPRQQTAAPGQPGSYDPDRAPAERPQNLGDMSQQVQPATQDRWPAGSYVLLRNGRHVHWDGAAWRGGDALEGPPHAAPDRSEPEQSDRSEPEQSEQ
jgi:hypothetical protein